MNEMFCNCLRLYELDISSFNINNVNFMKDMFCHCNVIRTLINKTNIIKFKKELYPSEYEY
jgi:hypothetical protein